MTDVTKPGTYEYEPSLATDKDRVRFLVQDVVDGAWLLSDEEYTWLLTQYGSIEQAALQALYTLSRRYSLLADKAVGDLSISYSQLSANFAARAKEVLDLAGGAVGSVAVATPYAGGLSISEKEADREDTDLVQPYFTPDMMKNRTHG